MLDRNLMFLCGQNSNCQWMFRRVPHIRWFESPLSFWSKLLKVIPQRKKSYKNLNHKNATSGEELTLA